MNCAKLLLRIAAFLMLLCVLVLTCQAQGDGYATNNNARGVLPFGSYHVGDIDNISLSTGTVNLRIPLTERKGRGFDTGQAFVYSSKIWVVRPMQSAKDPTLFDSLWWLPTTELQYGRIVNLEFGTLNWTRVSYTCTLSTGQQYPIMVDSNFIYTAGDGAHYQFPNRRYLPSQASNCVPPTSPPPARTVCRHPASCRFP